MAPLASFCCARSASSSGRISRRRTSRASTASSRWDVGPSGPPSRRAAERLGLGPMLTSFVNELDAPHRILLGFAAALGPNPDIVALDDPASDLDDHQVAQVMDAVRDLVDVEGRTVLIASDLHALPAGLRPLVDRIVELTPPAEE